MITEREINECRLSLTKKDFYQVWNELMDEAAILSKRWDPTSTNESDPGIVILKLLAGVTDKLNTEIDLNTLEGFMPSAAQIESMRKLTEMMGYNMRYYRSAVTDVKISYNTSKEEITNGNKISIDRFTNIKDSEDSINYVTLEQGFITKDCPSIVVSAIEGELVECETDDDNIISIKLLDGNNKYYLPETQVAENGIFVSNIDNENESEEWEKVENLNTVIAGKKVYKFGFDSKKALPYIQFPDDISSLIEDGLKIRYIRTSGVYGNISAGVLSKMGKPLSWSAYEVNTDGNINADWYNEENYRVSNASGTGNGHDIESINDAYDAYKKTIGTFDTLVTCRDYINYIYRMTSDGTTPLVSNINVADINSDINKAYTLCSFNKFGVTYENKSRTTTTDGATTDDISRFDLILYPFKAVFGLNTRSEYDKSFKYDDINIPEIKTNLEEIKTLSHNLRLPESSDIVAIKNYLKLRAKITTIRKVNALEQQSILNEVYRKLYETFNMHKVDFGEEIPYDSILECIENADVRIKSVSLDEPELKTAYCLADGTEVEAPNETDLKQDAIAAHNKLVLNNVLAGKISLFNYDKEFIPNFKELAYDSWTEGSETKSYAGTYPLEGIEIVSVEPRFTINNNAKNVKLNSNEVVQFRLQNMKTEVTYPAYVNYFIKLNTNESSTPVIGATMQTVASYLDTKNKWEDAANDAMLSRDLATTKEKYETNEALDAAELKYKKLFIKNANNNRYEIATSPTTNVEYYHLNITNDNSSLDIGYWNRWIKNQDAEYDDETSTTSPKAKAKLFGIYEFVRRDYSRNVGKLVDENHNIYRPLQTTKVMTGSAFDGWYVQQTFAETSNPSTSSSGHTMDGLGQDGSYVGIRANEEYELKSNEYLLINYTNSETVDEEERKTVINKHYGPGTIIRPNFELIDSGENRKLHSYSKTEGFDFTQWLSSNPSGMFTLGTDEQIEIRDFVEVKLDEVSTNIYWTRNDEDTLTDENGKITFVFNEDNNTAYTLKEGEYFYYTSKDKIDLAYYGNGTKIVKSEKTPSIYKYKTDLAISPDEISSYGLAASIPWRAFNLAKDGEIDRSLKLVEYRYLNLTKDDILESFDANGEDLTNEWVEVKDARYKTDSGSQSLDKINFTNHEVAWEARTKLELCVGPNAVQTLHNTSQSKDSIKINFKWADDKKQDTIDPVTLENHENNNLSFKTNELIIYSTAHSYDAVKKTYDESGQEIGKTADLKIKVFKEVDPEDAKGNSLNLENYGDGQFTKYSFGKELTSDGAFSLSVNVPAHEFGLMMVYYIKTNNAVTKNANIQSDIPLKIYNNGNIWWENLSSGNNYYLREGLNIVELSSDNGVSGELKFYSDLVEDGDDNKAGNGIVIFGNLDLVYKDTETISTLNPKLKYFYDSTAASAQTNANKTGQMLQDILVVDPNHQFYYNNIISNDTAIDLNEAEDEDLLNPRSLYDHNNKNNKFVISEIDSRELASGITIAKQSKI